MKIFHRTPKQIGYFNTALCAWAPANTTYNVIFIHNIWAMLALNGLWAVGLYFGFTTAHIKGGTEEVEKQIKANEARLQQAYEPWYHAYREGKGDSGAATGPSGPATL